MVMPEASTSSCQSAPASTGCWSSAQTSRNCSSKKLSAAPAILPLPGYRAPSAGHPLALSELGGRVTRWPQTDWQGRKKAELGIGGRAWGVAWGVETGGWGRGWRVERRLEGVCSGLKMGGAKLRVRRMEKEKTRKKLELNWGKKKGLKK